MTTPGPASWPVAPILARLAEELRGCVAEITRIETVLEPVVATLPVPARAQLQQLDLVWQVLAELADVLVAGSAAMHAGKDHVPGGVLDSLRLGALRDRLTAESLPRPDNRAQSGFPLAPPATVGHAELF